VSTALEFGAHETHGFFRVPGVNLTASSAGLGWPSLYVSSQREEPYKAALAGKPVILVAAVDVGPVRATVELTRASNMLRAASGAVSVLPDGQDIAIDLATSIKTTHVFVRRERFEEVAEPLIKTSPEALEVIPRLGIFDPFLSRLCSEVKDALKGDPLFSALYTDHLSSTLCAYLVRKHSSASAVVTAARERLNSRSLGKIREFVESRLQERITIKDIADELGLGPDHLGRLFKSTTGLTLYQFVIRCRIDLAQRLLSNTDTPIAMIAFESGFSDQVSLTRNFRKVTGVTPAAFRASGERPIPSVQSRRAS
jgi:AraC family transcriptional regulator